MKSKQLQELKNYTERELLNLLEQRQNRAFTIHAKEKSAPVKNPHEITEVRRDIARIKTIFRLKFNKKI